MRSFRRFLLPAAWAAVAVYGSSLLVAATEDPVLGTWTLNLAKSTFTPGPAPKSQTRIYEAHKNGVKATIKTIYADGESVSTEYIANYDGVEYPVTGSPASDAIALRRVNDLTAEATMRHAGKMLGTARRVISRDRKTMTITFEGVVEDRRVVNVSVYDRLEK